jgi:hypothetical protein
VAECPEWDAAGGGEFVPRGKTISERGDWRERDSLAENFNDEIEDWARRSLAANGFSEYRNLKG